MAKKSRAAERNARAARAAAAMKEQQRQEKRRRNFMIGGVVLVVLVIIAGGYFLSRSLDTTTDVAAPATGSKYGLTIGSSDAPHQVVIYEDFLCPFCGEFEKATRDDLSQLADDGKVTVEYRPFELLSTLGDYSARSAEAFSIVMDKSGPDVAKKFHDLLYENQPSEKGPFLSNEDMLKLAVQAGANESDVKTAITNADGNAPWVEGATQAALDAGVRGTPTILLDGSVWQEGSTPEEMGQKLIDQLS